MACEDGQKALECSGGLLTPTPPTKKPTARQDQTRQASTGDRARDGSGGERKVEDKLIVKGRKIARDIDSDLIVAKQLP